MHLKQLKRPRAQWFKRGWLARCSPPGEGAVLFPWVIHLGLAKLTIAAGFAPHSPGLDPALISRPLGVPCDLTAGVCRRAGEAWLTGESRPPWQETSLL